MNSPSTVFYEEDVEKLCEVAVQVFGPIGRMEYPHNSKDVMINAKIEVDGAGIIWYGDILEKEVAGLTNRFLSDRFVKSCNITDERIWIEVRAADYL